MNSKCVAEMHMLWLKHLIDSNDTNGMLIYFYVVILIID